MGACSEGSKQLRYCDNEVNRQLRSHYWQGFQVI